MTVNVKELMQHLDGGLPALQQAPCSVNAKTVPPLCEDWQREIAARIFHFYG